MSRETKEYGDYRVSATPESTFSTSQKSKFTGYGDSLRSESYTYPENDAYQGKILHRKLNPHKCDCVQRVVVGKGTWSDSNCFAQI